ncbi:MAG: hypothetical protein JXR63_08505 [Spirochaetales bacterium]|nr:hypothetical protein [Spirochaetales bacterium]
MKKLILLFLPLLLLFSCEPKIEGGDVDQPYTPSTISPDLKAPEGIQVVEDLGLNKIVWTRNYDADAYYVIASDSKDGTYTKVSENIQAVEWVDRSDRGGYNFYKVISVKLLRNGAIFLESTPSAAVNSADLSVVDQLAKPENFGAKYYLSSEKYLRGVRLYWDAVAGADYYRIQRAPVENGLIPPGEGYEFINNSDDSPLLISGEEFVDVFAKKGQYRYRVAAYKFGVGTQPEVSSEFTDLLRPNVAGSQFNYCIVSMYGDVENATATPAADNSSVTVTWDRNSQVHTYRVYKSVDGKIFELKETIGNNMGLPETLEWVDSSLGSESPIFYKIEAGYYDYFLCSDLFFVEMNNSLLVEIGGGE